MSEDRNTRIQELFLAALEIPLERRDAWLSEECEGDADILHEVQGLLCADNPTHDPLEAGVAGIVENGLLSVSCPRCKTSWEVDELRKEIRCPSCDEQIVRLNDDTVTFVRNGSDDTAMQLRLAGTAALNAEVRQSVSEGHRFGDYELLHEIARGGMGVVYKARQTKLNRVVALKMIKSGQFADDNEVRRFHAEAEAAAALDHPNIVPVYEVGEFEGQHFFSMGLVEGESLSAKLKDGPLQPRDTAELVKTIAEAVQFAHEKGIVHRDLKPGNVLIDAEGNPRVTDFGLAKQTTADSGMTATGQILGTPSYMPPEQASGKIDEIGPLSDVYSLGAMLYSSLAGRPPFQAASLMETLKQVLEQEPVSPRQLNPAVDRDLETICLKCLEKEATARYDSAQDLADELDRFLTHKPILARPVGRLERGLRWCKRNPLGAMVVGLLLFLAIAGPAVAVHQNRTNRKLDTALAGETTARTKAQQEKRETASALAKVRETLKLRDRALLETERSIDQYVQTVKEAKLLKDPRFKPLLKTLLKDALTHYQHFIAEHEGEQDEKTRARIADAFEEVGRISYESGSIDRAIKAFQQSMKIHERLARANPTISKYQNALARSHRNIGLLYHNIGKLNEAVLSHQQALAIRERLARENPGVTDFQYGLGKTHNSFGVLLFEAGKSVKALTEYQKAIKIHQRLVSENPAVEEYQYDLAASHNNIALLYRTTGKPVEALIAYQQALKIRQRLVNRNPGVAEKLNALATIHNNIGVLYRTTGKTAAALTAYQQALKIRERLVRENPTVTEYQDGLALSHGSISTLFIVTGRLAEAIMANQQALEIRERLVRENPTVTGYQNELAKIFNDRGTICSASGDMAESLKAGLQAIRIRERLTRENPSAAQYRIDLARSYNNSGVHYQHTGDVAKAMTAYQQAISTYERLVPDYRRKTECQLILAQSYHGIGAVLSDTGKRAEALMSYQQALKIRQRLVRENPTEVQHRELLAASYNNIAILYSKTGKITEAVITHEKALKIRGQLVRENPTVIEYQNDLAQSHFNMGLLLQATDKSTEAMTAYQQALKICERVVQKDPANAKYQRFLAKSLELLGLLNNKEGKTVAALKSWKRELTILEQLTRRHPNVASFRKSLAKRHSEIAEIHKAANAPLKQLNHLRSAVRIYPSDVDHHIRLGIALKNQDEFEQATLVLLEAIRRDPSSEWAHRSLGINYRKQGKLNDALRASDRAVELAPDDWRPHSVRGKTLLDIGRFKEAVVAFSRVITLHPKYAWGFYYRGLTQHQLGEFKAAKRDFEAASRLSSTRSTFASRLAWFLATCPEQTCRDGKLAVQFARKACEMTKWKSADRLDTLAAAYAESADFKQAVYWQAKALSLSSADARGGYRLRLALYKSGKPFRESRPKRRPVRASRPRSAIITKQPAAAIMAVESDFALKLLPTPSEKIRQMINEPVGPQQYLLMIIADGEILVSKHGWQYNRLTRKEAVEFIENL